MRTYALDIGKNTITLMHHQEVLFQQPALLAYDSAKKVLAIGQEAATLLGTRSVHPYKNTDELFQYLSILFEREHVFRLFQKVTIYYTCSPSFRDAEIEAIETFCIYQGANQVFYKPENLCAALGAQLQIDTSIPATLLHIGHSCATITIFENQEIVASSTNAMGGEQIETQIKKWILNTFHFQVSDKACQDIFIEIGQTQYTLQPKSIRVPGVDIVSQQLKYLELNENQMAEMLAPVLYTWSEWLYNFLNTLDYASQKAILQRGIVCSGSAAKLKNLCASLHSQLSIPFNLAIDPSHCVTKGLMQISEIEKK